MTRRGQASVDVEAPRGTRRGDEGKAQNPHQGGMLHKVLAQVGHIDKLLIELDQTGCRKGSEWYSACSPVGLQVALGEAASVQWTQPVQVPHGDGRLLDKGGQKPWVLS